MANNRLIQFVLENTKMEYTQVFVSSTIVQYKCVLRYEGRQLTSLHETSYNANQRDLDKKEVVFGLFQDFQTLQRCPTFESYAKEIKCSDKKLSEKYFKAMQQRGKGFYRLFGKLAVKVF